jgi:phenylacetate-CoA ligase
MIPEPRELLSRQELEARQEVRLGQLIAAIVPANPFWTRRFQEAGLDAAAMASLGDLRKLPLLDKSAIVEDQRQHPPYGTNLTLPLARYCRLHQTSGTTGVPLRWLDTQASWDWVVGCWSRIYALAEVSDHDVLAFPFSFGPFLGFWAAFEGASRLGALCLSGGGMTSQGRLRMIFDNAATVVCCTPTYALRLIEVAREEQLDLKSGPIRALIVAGEPGGSLPAIREPIESGWGARVFDHWGMTELGPLAVECVENPLGLHVLETECIVEVLDPVSHEPVAPGRQGELVVTNLGRLGSPLLRYRTGDLVAIDPDPCPCGRDLVRLKGGILGRLDEMFTVRGNNVFPSSLEAILREFPAIVEYRIEVQTRRAMHHVRVTVEPKPGAAVDALLAGVGRAIKDRLHFQAEVAAAAPGELPRFELKAKRFHRST